MSDSYNISMKQLEELLRREVGYHIPQTAIDKVLGAATLLQLKGGEDIVESGRVNPDVFIVKQGIIRYSDTSQDKERTFAFGLAGTLFMSMTCFWRRLPSWYRISACCPTEVLRIKREDYWRLVEEDRDVATWMLHIAHGQNWYQEHINSTVRIGSARERLEQMQTLRPEIIARVPQRIIASYLDISPEYLSRLKAQLLRR